jgi:hypothetical protein
MRFHVLKPVLLNALNSKPISKEMAGNVYFCDKNTKPKMHRREE